MRQRVVIVLLAALVLGAENQCGDSTAVPTSSPGTDDSLARPAPSDPTEPGSIPAGTSEPQVDYSCSAAGDCAVKNIGNCCGYYPRCVNVDHQPDLEAIADWCESNGVVSVCGWPEIDGCDCVENTCRSLQNGREV